MKDLSPITQPLFRRKALTLQPDPKLLSALLNLIQDPVLILNRGQGTIYSANAPFFRLSAYSLSEISNIPVHKILPDLKTEALSSGDSYRITLNRRQREPMPASVQVSGLDPAGLWLTLTVQAVENQPKNFEQLQSELHCALLSLFGLYEAACYEDALQEAVRIVREFLGTELVSLYQADSGYPVLKRIAGHEASAVFPAELPSTDLSLKNQEPLWVPGHRVISEAQRASRIAGLSWLATIPLGQPNAQFGLLLAGGRQSVPSETVQSAWGLLAASITSVLQHQLLVHRLQQDLNEWDQHHLVHDVMFENTPIGIILVDQDFNIIEMNQTAEELFGYANNEVRSQQVEKIVIGTDRLSPALHQAVTGIHTPTLGKVSLNRRNGQSFPADIQVLPAMREGSPQAVMLFVQDMSENEGYKTRTQQLEQRALIGELTAMFAHEVRNPMNNLYTGVQLMASRLPADEQNQDLLRRMEDDFSRLNRLMEELLAFSRPMETRNELIDPNALLVKIIDRWRPRMMRKKIEIFYKPEESLPKIYGDMRSLEQVFTNLISNAIDAMGEQGGVLAISVQTSTEISNHPHVVITVSDNGPGIPDEIRERIFDPFVTNKPTGTGLGLAITKRIVTAHKGNIRLNTFPGGTIFEVGLPIAEVA